MAKKKSIFFSKVVSFFSRVKDFKSTRYKVILFSNFLRSSVSFTIVKRYYFFFFVIVALLGFMTFEFYISLNEKRIILKRQEAISKTYSKRIVELDRYVQQIQDYEVDYQKGIEGIFSSLADFDGEQLWSAEWVYIPTDDAPAGFKLSLETPQDEDSNQFINMLSGFALGKQTISDNKKELIEVLNKSTIRTSVTLEHLRDIDSYINLREDLRRKIPNGWPLKEKVGYKTSGFGPRASPFSGVMEFHAGVDIAAAKGSVIVAAADGKVRFSGQKSGFGLVVSIDHPYGHRSLYAHCDVLLVNVGDEVKKGQPIARLGSSGRSTGYHLHYEVRLKSKFVDPWPYVIVEF